MQGFLRSVGLAMICIGVFALCYLCYAVFLVFQNPLEFELTKLLLSALDISEPLITISSGGNEVLLDAAKPLRYFLFAFIGFFLVHIFISISNGVLSAGVRLIKFSTSYDSYKSNETI